MKITATSNRRLVIGETGRPTTTAILEHLNWEVRAALGTGRFTRGDNDTIYYEHNYAMEPLRVALLAYSAVLHHAFGRQRTVFVDSDGTERIIDDSGDSCPKVIDDRMTVEVRIDEPLCDGKNVIPGFYIVVIFPNQISDDQYNDLKHNAPASLKASLFDMGHHRSRIDYLTDLSITTPYEVAATVGSYLAAYFGFEGYLLIMLNGTARYVTINNDSST